MGQPLQKLEQAIEETIAHAIPQRGRWRTVARIVGWALVVVYFLFALAVLFLRYYALPKVGEYKGDIEQLASKALGQRITVGTIEAGWQGLRPELLLADVTIYDRDGRAALTLPVVEATVSWISALIGRPRFYSLVFDRPRLEIRRDEAGKFYVAGIELHSETGDAGIAQWVLAQREIAIRDASVTWDDQLRGAPQLALPALNFVLRSGLLGHRFALRAKPPAELASALDVRGELNRGDLADWESWTGELFAELEYTDLIAWRPWVDYPLDLRSGKGGVRLWVTLGGKSSSEATVDVALSQVAMRVAKGLPLLELDTLQGRLGASQSEGKSFEVFGRNVTFRSGTGVALSPTDFRVLWQPEDGQTPQKGEMEANTLDLARLARLTEFFPFPRAARERLAATDPRGSVHNLKVTWTGDVENPQQYSLRGAFSNLAARANNRVPGFAGLTGRLEASEKGGNIVLGSEQVAIELPEILPESPVRLDSLAGQINWKIVRNQLELGFNSLSIANRDLAGTFFGNYSTKEGSGGAIDLTGRLSRADGRAAYRYIPLLPAKVAEYLKTAIREGRSKDVRLRVKGDLAKFPFEDSSSGIFQIVAKVTDADLHYAEAWPQASGISGDLIFEGRSMRVVASKASIVNVQVSSLRVNIPDLFHRDVHLGIEIRAEDRTSDFLRFIAQSPVTQALDRVTEGMRATGTGRLALQLDIPTRNPERFKVSGGFEFVNNELRVDSDAPPFSQLNGRIEFTESAISARAVTLQFLGGPATISVATRADGMIAASAQGTANTAQIPRSWGEAVLRQISGAAAWQGTLTVARGRPTTLLVQSQLTGITSNLPAPLAKAALEPMPLTIERVVPTGSRGDTIAVSLGRAVNARILRRRDGAQYVVERGVISLNEPAMLGDREGIAVTGSLDYVDVDRWRALFGSKDEAGPSTSPLFDLKVAALDFGGRRLNDVTLRAETKGSVLEANVTAKELAGEIKWFPEGLGRVEARLRHFSMPEATPGRKEEAPSRDLPALDIVADKLILNGNDLGRLELVAVNKALDWSVEKLVLNGPESTLTAKGTWESWALRPKVSIDGIELEVRDVGKYLDRIGYPDTMRRGAAALKGNLSWAGSPQSIDFATLTGNLALEAQKGQFLKADSGAAKLLGVLGLQSLITLDFRELEGRGFAFDTISSTATIANGVMTARKFEMRGPSAQVSMKGEVDLSRETQNLHVRVVPPLGDSIATGVVFLHPIWGLGALLAQRILKDPLGQIFAVEYSVTGTWDQPVAKRLKVEAKTPVTDPQGG